MTHQRRLTSPPLYRDDTPLQPLWFNDELSIGRIIAVDGRDYRVLGCDPVSVRPCRVYLKDVGSGRQHALVLRHEQE